MRKLILPKPTNLTMPERRIFIPRVPSRFRQRGFMRLMPSLGIWGKRSEFLVDGADFDGANDYMLRGGGLTGAADSQQFILSFWFRLDAHGVYRTLFHAPASGLNGFEVFHHHPTAVDNKIWIFGWTGASFGVTLNTTIAFTTSATWHHFLCAVDTNQIANSYIYVDDVDRSAGGWVGTPTLDFTTTQWALGAVSDGSGKFNGCLAEFYFAIAQFMNISVEANRRKFRTSAGKPAFLGADGSLPTGSVPIVYQHLDDGEAVANFATNRGSGGNFSITGALATASSSPSD